MTAELQLLTIRDVLEITKAGRATIYDWMRDRDFPRPLKIGGRNVRWIAREVDTWLKEQPRSGRT